MLIRKSFVGLLLMLGCSLAGTAFAYSGNVEDITLSVTVEKKVSPNLAYVNYTVMGSGLNSKLAAEEAATKAAAVKKALLKNAITSDMLEQVSYKINPMYNDKRKVVGYKAVNSLKVRVDQLDKLGEIIDTLSAGGVDNVGNISYTLKNREVYQDSLLQDAVRTARKKALVLAEAGGRSLGRLLSVRVNSYTAMPRMANAMLMKTVENADSVATVIENKDIELHADIEAAFALE